MLPFFSVPPALPALRRRTGSVRRTGGNLFGALHAFKPRRSGSIFSFARISSSQVTTLPA